MNGTDPRNVSKRLEGRVSSEKLVADFVMPGFIALNEEFKGHRSRLSMFDLRVPSEVVLSVTGKGQFQDQIVQSVPPFVSNGEIGNDRQADGDERRKIVGHVRDQIVVDRRIVAQLKTSEQSEAVRIDEGDLWLDLLHTRGNLGIVRGTAENSSKDDEAHGVGSVVGQHLLHFILLGQVGFREARHSRPGNEGCFPEACVTLLPGESQGTEFRVHRV